jgi:endonuclease I
MKVTPASFFAVAWLSAGLAWPSPAQADPPPGYYAATEGKTGAELRAVLHRIVRGHNVVPYNSGSRTDTVDALKVLDADPDTTNNVLLVYAPGVSVPASSYGTTGWNREHLWPNSFGLDDTEPAVSDLHNLRACDANVNSARGNKCYDTSDTNSPSYKFPAHAEAPSCSTDSDSWEPPNSQKGDIARALLYLAVRYTGDATNEPVLRLTDNPALIASTNACMGRFTTLLKWHFTDPVDSAESNRNDRVYWLFQTNRNPFVDHPEFVAAAFVPPLQIAATVTNVLLRWAADYSPTLRAEQAASCPGVWTLVTNLPVLASNFWTLTLPAGSESRFYRLRLE